MPRPFDEYGPVFPVRPLPEAEQPKNSLERLKALAQQSAPADPTATPPAPALGDDPARDAESSTRMWMTAMKLFNPLVRAVVSSPAQEYTPDRLMIDFFDLLRNINAITADLVAWLRDHTRMDPHLEENRWVLRQILPMVSEAVADQWRQHGRVDPQITGALYQDALKTLLMSPDPAGGEHNDCFLEAVRYDERFLQIPAKDALLLSQMAAMQPLISELSLFSAWRDPGIMAGDMASVLNECAEYLYNLHDTAQLSDRGRLTLIQACVKHAGAMLHDAFRVHSAALTAERDALPDDQREDFMRGFRENPARAEQWILQVASDARKRCQILHEASLAHRASLKTLLSTLPNP